MSVDLRGLLLRLLREDEEFRLAVMGLLGYSDVKSSVDRLVEAVNELTKAVKSHDERLTRLENAVEELTKAVRSHEERLTRLESAVEELTRAVKAHEDRLTRVEDRLTRLENAVEELTKAVKEQSKAIEELAKIVKSHEDRLAKVEEAIKAFDRRLMALRARWGVESEEAFRNAMMGVVEGILGVATVGKWVYFDKDGVVYGHPSQVEVDVAIRDGTHILIEIKASASSGDALEFSRVGNLYETVTGIKPRLVLVTPFIDDRGLEAARKLGIEVYTSV
ncbi:MAG: hypothetical protein AT713_06645 [Caldivirga sp. JCHS_4]|jgi:Uncharacterized conserved protein containing a coiled-coil domain|nr:MAG: hypothetical protein AT713_06645 [Caldivirga sp. JCHS_4]